MASWVSASIAAEMWKMSINEIDDRIKRGEIESKDVGGFLFVNIDSASSQEAAHEARLTPPTYSIVTREEERALLETMSIASARELVSKLRRRPIAA